MSLYLVLFVFCHFILMFSIVPTSMFISFIVGLIVHTCFSFPYVTHATLLPLCLVSPVHLSCTFSPVCCQIVFVSALCSPQFSNSFPQCLLPVPRLPRFLPLGRRPAPALLMFLFCSRPTCSSTLFLLPCPLRHPSQVPSSLLAPSFGLKSRVRPGICNHTSPGLHYSSARCRTLPVPLLCLACPALP